MSKEKLQQRTILFINPPRSIQALTISPGIVHAARRVEHLADAPPALMAWVIKHCSRWGEKRETSIDLKMSCSVIFKSFHLHFFLSLCWQSASGHGSGVYRMFCDQFFFFVPACVCVLMHVSNLVSCRIHTRRQESHISDKVQPIKYNS